MEKLLQLIDHGNKPESRKEAERLLSQLHAFERVFGQMHRERDEAQAHNVYLVNLIRKAQANDGRIKESDIQHALQLDGRNVLTTLIVQQRIAGISQLLNQLRVFLPTGSDQLKQLSLKAGEMISQLAAHQDPNIKGAIIVFGEDNDHAEH